jgi:glycosyltransferase involved in cell wall biosynthesis
MATFASALGGALEGRGASVNVVRALSTHEFQPLSSSAIAAELVASDPRSWVNAAAALNRCDVALVQHEYGLYGGLDGSYVVNVLDALSVPSMATLHTVLPKPTRNQFAVLNAVMEAVNRVIVMTESARRVLLDVYLVSEDKLSVIPHGAALMSRTSSPRGDRPILLTWGLIGPGKGIEWVIDAMATLKDLEPRPLYIVAGRTHPKVFERNGDVYRRSLEQRVLTNQVADMVLFDNTYRTFESLNGLIEQADVVVLPYDSIDQATSGVLVDAVAAGRPVVATSFPHAVELLSSNAGIVVPQRDVAALGDALRRIMTNPTLALEMAAAALRIAPLLSWDAVSSQYLTLASEILSQSSVSA